MWRLIVGGMLFVRVVVRALADFGGGKLTPAEASYFVEAAPYSKKCIVAVNCARTTDISL